MAELAALIVGTARGIGARGGRNVDGFSSSLSVVHTNGKRYTPLAPFVVDLRFTLRRPIGPLLYPCRPTETPRQCQMVAYVRDPLAVHADLYFELSVEWREILNSSCTLVHGFMDGLPLAWDVSHQNHQPHHHLKYSAHYAE
ncbi:hypothetical protein BC830DRAFT_1163256 [Chytriomyces sp. MP71]|nr:hypothetical protein BC830DRAFT_1163256 [Chytriomyces sp. MP71]